jgi:hypothetical protein
MSSDETYDDVPVVADTAEADEPVVESSGEEWDNDDDEDEVDVDLFAPASEGPPPGFRVATEDDAS